MKIPKGYTPFDPLDYIKTEEDIGYFLQAAFEENDPHHIARALAVVAKVRSMSKVAKKAGISRTALYKALNGDANLEFSTILKIVGALGMKLQIV